MARLYANNYTSTIATAINNSVTSITVTNSTGLPTISGSDYYNLTIAAGGAIEIVKVTARSGNILTVTRAQESTTAKAWDAGTIISLRPTAASFTAVVGGPVSSTDNAVVRWDGTTGNTIQNSGVLIDDSNNLTVPSSVIVGGNSTAAGYIDLLEDTDNGSNKITITAPQAIASDKTVTLQDVTGTVYVTNGTDVAVADGGTGNSSATAYALIAGGTTSTGAFQSLGTGSSGQFLYSGGAAALPSWTTPTYPTSSVTSGKIIISDGINFTASTATFANTYTANNLLYASSSNTVAGLATANNGFLNTSATGVPSIVTPSAVTIATGDKVLIQDVSNSDAFAYATAQSIADLVGSSSNAILDSDFSTNGFMVRTAAGTYTSRTIASGDSSNITVTNGDGSASPVTINVPDNPTFGGTGAVTISGGTTAQRPANGAKKIRYNTSTSRIESNDGSGWVGYISSATNFIFPASDGSANQYLKTDGSGNLSWGTPSGGSGGLTWTSASGTTQAAAVNSGYVCTNASQCNVTLPATAAVGDIVAVVSQGAGGIKVTANTGQTVKGLGDTTTSAGSVTCAAQYDAIEVICVVANTTWVVRNFTSSLLTFA